MKSDNINELAAALAKVQEVMPAAKMNSTNPFLKNKYADLGSVIEAARKPLAANNLSVSQLVEGNDENIGVTTMLMHSSGQWLESTVSMAIGVEKGKSAAQVAGSIITYLRRYSLASILGIYADEDGDGNAPEQKQRKQQAPARKPTATMTLQTALEVTNSEGEMYGTIDSDKLDKMTIGIRTGLKKTDISQEQRDEYQMKLDAIALILASRR